jgi:hypothetical protein
VSEPPGTTPLVSIVIVNFNGSTMLCRCLRSVFSQEYRLIDVIVVDNSSVDDSVALVRREFPEVRLVCNEHNLGFAEGCNLGVRASNAELIVLLNNDTEVLPGWLEALVNAVRPDEVAIASSLVLTEGVPEKYYEKNGSINFLGHNIMRVFAKRENIFYGGGASVIYKKAVLGIPFDPCYFAYGEDVYLSLRARFKGLHVVHANNSVVNHKGSATTNLMPDERKSMLQERNRLLNILLFFSPWTIVRVFPLLLANSFVKLAGSLLFGMYSPAGIFKAYTWLLSHVPLIAAKRSLLRSNHVLKDQEITSLMTARLTNGETTLGRVLNTLGILYCKLVQLKTIESLPAESR